MTPRLARASKLAKATALVMAATLTVQAVAQDTQSKLTEQMGITQNLGARIPLDVTFKDETGKTVRIGDTFEGRPVLLVPIFFTCKTMCVNLTDSIVGTLAKGTRSNILKPGRDFDVVMLSINPTETPELARAKKVEIFDMLTPTVKGQPNEAWRTEVEPSWKMLTGSYENIRKVTDAVGFKYHWDAEKKLINHPTCSILLSKTGKVSGYIIGNDLPTAVFETDLKLAKNEQVAPKADQSFMFGCIMIDPTTGKYTVVVEKVLQVACVLTVILLAGAITLMSLRERRRLRSGEDLHLVK
jgi:protein SCO1/2